MSISFSKLPTVAGDAIIFGAIGDGFDDAVVVDAQMVPDAHNPGAEVLKIDLRVDDELRTFWARSPGQLQALGKAGADAGARSLAPGGYLSVHYVGDKELRGGKSMKLYSAEYTEPA